MKAVLYAGDGEVRVDSVAEPDVLAPTDAVVRVCHKGLSVDEAVALLLGRSTKPE